MNIIDQRQNYCCEQMHDPDFSDEMKLSKVWKYKAKCIELTEKT